MCVYACIVSDVRWGRACCIYCMTFIPPTPFHTHTQKQQQQQPSSSAAGALWKECEACLWAVRSIAPRIPIPQTGKEEEEGDGGTGAAMRHIMQVGERG